MTHSWSRRRSKGCCNNSCFNLMLRWWHGLRWLLGVIAWFERLEAIAFKSRLHCLLKLVWFLDTENPHQCQLFPWIGVTEFTESWRELIYPEPKIGTASTLETGLQIGSFPSDTVKGQSQVVNLFNAQFVETVCCIANRMFGIRLTECVRPWKVFNTQSNWPNNSNVHFYEQGAHYTNNGLCRALKVEIDTSDDDEHGS